MFIKRGSSAISTRLIKASGTVIAGAFRFLFMKFTVLGSGSTSNAVLVSSNIGQGSQEPDVISS